MKKYIIIFALIALFVWFWFKKDKDGQTAAMNVYTRFFGGGGILGDGIAENQQAISGSDETEPIRRYEPGSSSSSSGRRTGTTASGSRPTTPAPATPGTRPGSSSSGRRSTGFSQPQNLNPPFLN